jgi:hypothetical protein
VGARSRAQDGAVKAGAAGGCRDVILAFINKGVELGPSVEVAGQFMRRWHTGKIKQN